MYMYYFLIIASFLQVIQDYTTPPQKELSRDLEATIKPYIRYVDVRFFWQIHNNR